MDDAPAIAMNFMRYKLFLYFSSLSKGGQDPLDSPGIRHWYCTYLLIIYRNI